MTWLQCLRSSTERQVHKSTDSYGEEFLMNKVASTVAHSSGARNMYRLLHFLQDVNFVNNFTTAQSSYRTRRAMQRKLQNEASMAGAFKLKRDRILSSAGHFCRRSSTGNYHERQIYLHIPDDLQLDCAIRDSRGATTGTISVTPSVLGSPGSIPSDVQHPKPATSRQHPVTLAQVVNSARPKC